MKKTRSLMAAFLTLTLITCFTTGAFAASADIPVSDHNYQLEADVEINLNDTTVTLKNAVNWAYMDYARSKASEKANILKARSIVMQQTDWAADGFTCYYTAPDGTVETLPSFSEVFPDWDISQIWAYRNKVDALSSAQGEQSVQTNPVLLLPQVSPRYGRIFSRGEDFTCSIPRTVGGANAPDVYSMLRNYNTKPNEYEATILSLSGPDTCSIGFSMLFEGSSDKTDICYKQDMPVGGILTALCIAPSGPSETIYMRVSTNSTSGTGEFNFSEYSLYYDGNR